LALYEKSQKLYARIGDAGSRAFALWGMGGCYRRLGDAPRARRLYESSLRIFRQVGDHRGQIMALLGMGRVESALHRNSSALRVVGQALSLARKNRLQYETLLAEWEKARLNDGKSFPLVRFRRCGIPPTVPPRWRDLP
jgi:tetratricopeptide (TPR) repeat protein